MARPLTDKERLMRQEALTARKKMMGYRIIVIQCLLLICVVLLGAKSFEVQIIQAQDLSRKAEQAHLKHLTITGDRGQILDRQMNKLATSIDAPTVTADPSLVKDPAKTALDLARILGEKKSALLSKLSQKRRFVILAEEVSRDQAARIRTLGIQGIHLQNGTRRFYPNRGLAAQVIGFTGRDGTGLEGIEFKNNAILQGQQVRVRVKRDGAGRLLDIDKNLRERLRGNALVLTIDKKIQFLSEQALEQTVRAHRAKSGMALVMQPDTGELLAVAHYPGFNPNNWQAFDRFTFRNRAVTDAFEPGSIMKIFTVAAGLEKGIPPKSIFFCENGKYRIGGFTVKDTHSYEWLSLSQIVKFSSNIGAAKITETIGNKALHQYLTEFGFGDKPRVGCPGESAGTLLPYRRWSKIDAGAISFGQGVSVSAVQLVSAISAMANNGRLMQPMLVKKVIAPDGREIQTYEPKMIRQAVTPRTAALVKEMMSQVVREKGTGTRAAVEGYSVCGKTSTAQKAGTGNQGYLRGKYISAFGGFAPQKDPKLAVLVVVDEPRKQHYGGIVAAPAFKAIMAQSFNYLNIPPETAPALVASLASPGTSGINSAKTEATQ